MTTAPPMNRRRRRGFAVAVVLLAAVLFHAPLLRGVANFLIFDARFAEAGDVAPVKNDPECLEIAADLYAAGLAKRIVLVPGFARRTDVLGITPPVLDEVRGELIRRGVAERDIETLSDRADDLASRVGMLAEYVQRHPERRLTLAASRFQGRYVRHLAYERLDAAARERVAFASAESTQYDERRWWTARPAVQQVLQGYLNWIIAGWLHVPERRHRPIDVAAFEATLAQGPRP